MYGSKPQGYRTPTNSPGFSTPNHLGNREPSTGDGNNYKGRGFNQITWKSSYKKWGDKLGLDLISNPDLVLNADVAAKISALWYLSGGVIPKQVWKKSYNSVKEYFNQSIQNVDNGIYVYARATNGWGNGTPDEQIQKANGFKKYFQIKYK
jgi:predicted chitinase